MKTLTRTLMVALSLFLISCGNMNTATQQNTLTEYITSDSGVDFKEPNKVITGQNLNNSEIVLSLDTNQTFYLRSRLVNPNGSVINSQELEGVRGTYKTTNLGELKLYRNGKEIARTQTASLNTSQLNLQIFRTHSIGNYPG
jgi:hypothetical protein